MADTGNNRVQAFTRAGKPSRIIGTDALSQPVDVVVGADGSVFVADSGSCSSRQPRQPARCRPRRQRLGIRRRHGQAATPGELVDGTPIGHRLRVPMIVVSPWTTGGYACSETFDHSLLRRFLERRFGVAEPLISAWRRKTSGDLTSAFRFNRRPARYPADDGRLRYPADDGRLRYHTTVASLHLAQRQVRDNPDPRPPAGHQKPPSDQLPS